MLGWSIHVFPANASGSHDSPDLVCSWQTGLGGTDWLNRMVEARRALMVRWGGYPSAYVMRWEDLLPELLQQPRPYEGPTVIGEDYVMEQGWWQGKKVNVEALKRCQPNTIMQVNAWDQS